MILALLMLLVLGILVLLVEGLAVLIYFLPEIILALLIVGFIKLIF